MHRRRILASSLALSLAPAVSLTSAWAQAPFPVRPLVIVVPWPAGGATDVTTRAVADALTRELGHAVQVENRPGANGAIGLAHAARVEADGYTLATATADTHSINPHLRSDLPYDALDGLTPLVIYGTTYWAWMARPDFPANNLAELVALARQKPGTVSFASWGQGSTAHLAGALLESATGIQLNHVPFPGSAPASTALQGSHVDLLPIGRAVAENLRNAGRVKVLAVSAPTRSRDVLADVPTLVELGHAAATAGSWYGISVRGGIAAAPRTRLQEALVKVLGRPEVVAKIVAAGMEPVRMYGEALARFTRAEYERYGGVIRARQIKPA